MLYDLDLLNPKELLMFVKLFQLQAEEPMTDEDKKPPRRFPCLAPQELLTLEEIADLRREAKETKEWFQKAFAHLRPKTD
jgi:hypothetical protein